MAPATLELTIMGAENVKNVSTLGKMNLYAVAWIDLSMKRSTRVVYKSGRDPVWNDSVSLPVENFIRQDPNSFLTVQIFSEASIGDKLVGTARLPLQEIYRLTAVSGDEPALVTLQLGRPSGRAQGIVRLSMRLVGDARQEAQPSYAQLPNYADNKIYEPVEGVPVLGIPVGPGAAYYGSYGDGTTPTGFPPLPSDPRRFGSSSASASTQGVPYAYPPAAPAYDSYPYQDYARGYAQPAPPQQDFHPQVPYAYVQPPQPQRSNNLLLGILGGALGGLILGDIFLS